MGKRHEVTDEEWEAIQDLLPGPKKTGRPREDERKLLNGMFWILNTGAPWRDLPDRYGPFGTVFGRFTEFRQNGTLDRILERLQMRLDQEGRLDWRLFCIDGSSIRAHVAAAGAKKGGP